MRLVLATVKTNEKILWCSRPQKDSTVTMYVLEKLYAREHANKL